MYSARGSYILDILFYKKEIEIKKTPHFSAILTRTKSVAFSLLFGIYLSHPLREGGLMHLQKASDPVSRLRPNPKSFVLSPIPCSWSKLCLVEFYTASSVFQLLNGDGSQLHVSWTIFNQYLTSTLS